MRSIFFKKDYRIIFPAAAFVSLVAFWVGCAEHGSAIKNRAANESANRPKLSLVIVDSIRFRRSYAGHQQWTEKEAAYRRTCYPNIDEVKDSALVRRLNEAGIMKGDSLLTDNFSNITGTTLKSPSGNVLHLTTNSQGSPLRYTIHLFNGTDSAGLQLSEDVRNVKMAFSELIADDYPEIIVLRSHYFMNGDNYFINIYQVMSR